MNFVDLVLDAVTSNKCVAAGGSKNAGNHGKQSSFSGSIGSQKPKDSFVFNHQIQLIYCQFSIIIPLRKVLDNKGKVPVLIHLLYLIYFLINGCIRIGNGVLVVLFLEALFLFGPEAVEAEVEGEEQGPGHSELLRNHLKQVHSQQHEYPC